MLDITLINETGRTPDGLARAARGIARLTVENLETALSAPPDELTLIDINFHNVDRLLSLKKWLSRKNRDAKVVFITDELSRAQEMQIYAIGGTGFVNRRVEPERVFRKIVSQLKKHQDDPLRSLIQKSQDLSVVTDGLQNIFALASNGSAIDAGVIHSAGDAVISKIGSLGLAEWVSNVRMYHLQTYQHCLLVMTFAIAFGQRLGLARTDIQRLSFAGMVHDIGKARIPLSILEKPSALDDNEIDIMKKHPQLGFDMLLGNSEFPAEMLDMVIHHHEYLDGSGYPHGIGGREISDLVRVMTISDVFAALVERRSYKSPLSGHDAYRLLLDMDKKLDKDLVREFEFVSQFDE